MALNLLAPVNNFIVNKINACISKEMNRPNRIQATREGLNKNEFLDMKISSQSLSKKDTVSLLLK